MSGSDRKGHYTGRFAPSPTGPLHFGSLVAAVASYLDAKARHGDWLVRIENIDPPREIPGASDTILRQLEQHSLHWDGDILYQSTRSEAYNQALEQLRQANHLFPCACSRQELNTNRGVHPTPCRDSGDIPDEPFAWRVAVGPACHVTFDDCLQGRYQQDLAETCGDFILLRKDRLFAYQLAVTVDDDFQKITHVIRGCDLLDSTPRQLFLQQLLGLPSPLYGHLPIVINSDGEKLSKQTHAPPINNSTAPHSLFLALRWLRLSPPPELKNHACEEQLEWALQHWSRIRLKGLAGAPLPASP